MQNIIIYSLKNAHIDILLEYENILIDKVGDNGGIYILHNKNKIYYIGKGNNLIRRIKQHLRGKHADKWDSFSLYVVSNNKFLGELEHLLIRTVNPKGNNALYQKEIKISEMELKKAIKEFNEEKIESYFPSQVSRRKTVRRKEKIDYYKQKDKGIDYNIKYKGIIYSVKCLGDKFFVYRNKKYRSLTAVAKLITGSPSINGCVFFGLK
jgi:excinuclease UvrABC nuclease subunit